MAWREWTPMEERIRFVMELERGSEGMSGLCRRYGISRKTGYKWLFRYREGGLEGLRDRLRAPHRIPHKTPPGIEELVVEERVNHPTWGPKKLAYVLKTKHGICPPAASTIGEVLKRRGMIEPRRRKASVRCWPHTLKEAKGPNDLWSADFKGWFRTADRSKCHPLTISDRFSRYVLCCRLVIPWGSSFVLTNGSRSSTIGVPTRRLVRYLRARSGKDRNATLRVPSRTLNTRVIGRVEGLARGV